MKAIEIGLLIALALIAAAMVYLATELERTRAVIEPFARSPLVRPLLG